MQRPQLHILCKLRDFAARNPRQNRFHAYRPESSNMALVTYISHDGNSIEVNVSPGTSVMQAAVDNMIDGIVGECGGSCSCATCHCYVDETWVSRIPAASGMEKDMLECVLEPRPNSRLSCQIVVTDALDGLVIRLPESQF
jgi:2Fe-2S ferredoxin